HARRDAFLENCFFYSSRLYEFLHSQGHFRRIGALPPLTGCPLYPRKRTSSEAMGMSALCQNVWPGRAVQDGLPRSTNVRAASMYQASEVEQFAPGHHGYPRASGAD